jgi:DNA repair photolyase
MPEGRGQYYLNPYVGCAIGCEWCYVAERADFSRELEGLPRLSWGRWVDVKQNAPEVLRQEVARHTPGIVRLSPIVTDPYQPLERRFRITRGCLEVLLEAGFSPCILTRSSRVLDDLPLLARFPHAAVGFSIPTDDDAVRRVFEPGAEPIEDRIEALQRLKEAGLSTFAVIQPVLPGNPERLAERLSPLIDVVRVDRMYGPGAHGEPQQEAALRDAFSRRGVPESELDDLSPVLSGGPWCGERT